MTDEQQKKGLGNQTVSGKGATWGAEPSTPDPGEHTAPIELATMKPGPTPERAVVPPPREVTDPAAQRSEFKPLQTFESEETPELPPETNRPPAEISTDFYDEIDSGLAEVGGAFMKLLRTMMRAIISPTRRAVRSIRDKVENHFKDRLVDSDTFELKRAEDWQRFHKGKTSSSYLQDIDKKR